MSSPIPSSSSSSEGVSLPPTQNDEFNIPQEFKNDQKNWCTPRKYIFVSSIIAPILGTASLPFVLLNLASTQVYCCSGPEFCGASSLNLNSSCYFSGSTNLAGLSIIPSGYSWLGVALATAALGVSIFSMIQTCKNQKKGYPCNRRQWACCSISGIFTCSSVIITTVFAIINLSLPAITNICVEYQSCPP